MPGRNDADGGGGEDGGDGETPATGLSSGAEICGFLKISIAIFHANQIPPSLSARNGGAGDANDDVLYRAQLLNYCLRVNLHFC